jgi:hypothetical protein
MKKFILGLLVLISCTLMSTSTLAKQVDSNTGKTSMKEMVPAETISVSDFANAIGFMAVISSEMSIPNLNGEFIYWHTPKSWDFVLIKEDNLFPLARSRLRCISDEV